jgi:stage II sporulation protein GA (sporulation sigma-E factor processing peptidase)
MVERAARTGVFREKLRLEMDKVATNFFASGRYTGRVKSVGGDPVVIYADLVILLNFLVDFFLLAGTNRLAGYGVNWKRSALAAAIGSIYAGACLFPQLSFLGNTLWRLVSLGIMSAVCFGWNFSAFRRGILFSLLSMALGGVALGLNKGGFLGLILSSAALWAMCHFGFRGKAGQAEYVAVEITCRGKTHRLTALRDTGNNLCDPVTGQRVLIVGADVAWDILGLTAAQLQDPIVTMSQGGIPGLRLIPYRTVGKPRGMLLAAKVDKVVIDGSMAGNIVAFAPEMFRGERTYQALTGGAL